MGRRCISLELDVRDRGSIERMAREAEAAFGQIHILVNNAGLQRAQAGAGGDVGRLEPVLDTNLRGSFFVAQAVARGMIAARLRAHHQHRFGHQSCSDMQDLAPYGASRGGIRQLTMSLADDWGGTGSR